MAQGGSGQPGGGGGAPSGGGQTFSGGGYDINIARNAARQLNMQPPMGVQMGTPAYDDWVMKWFTAGVQAGDERLLKLLPGGHQAEGSGSGNTISDWHNAAPSSEWMGKRKPTAPELRRFAIESGGILGEDYERFGDRVLADWINKAWDVTKGGFYTTSGQQVAKPPDVAGDHTWVQGYEGSGEGGRGGGGGGGRQAPAPAAPAAPTTGYQQQDVPGAPTTTTTGAPLPTPGTGGATGVGGMTAPPESYTFTNPGTNPLPPPATPPPPQQLIKPPDVWGSGGRTGIGGNAPPAPMYSSTFGAPKQDNQQGPQFFTGGTSSQRGWNGGGQWVTSDEQLKTKGLSAPPARKFTDWRK